MKKSDVKAILLACLPILFESVVYFISKLSPLSVTVLSSEFDNNLPFIPFFACFYYLWFLFLLLIPFILNRYGKKYFLKYVSISFICVILGAIVFIFYPTTIDHGVNLDEYKSIFTYLVRFIYFTDSPNLCCLPSMHCALSFIFIYNSLRVKEMKWYYKVLITFASLGIVASTLFIKQHVIWDVYAAIVVVIISILIDRFTNVSKLVNKIVDKAEGLIDKLFEKTKLGNLFK